MSKLAYDDSWEQEFTSESHGNWRDKDLLPETKAIMEENERIKAERKVRQESRGTLPFSEQLAIEVCERVSSGELLINIAADEHMPTVRRITQWLKSNSDFAALYRESINDRLTIFEEEVIKIADDASRDFRDVIKNGRTVRVLDGEAIARAKLRVEVRFRHLKALKPSVWGEQSTLNVKSADTDIENMSQEELDQKLAELEHKDRVAKAA
jgi:hypothetical protein